MNTQRQVAFSTDKHGRRIAYRWSDGRWFRMALAEAELQIATEQARQVRYVVVRDAVTHYGPEAY